jgi:hypothetical protein
LEALLQRLHVRTALRGVRCPVLARGPRLLGVEF